MKNLKIERITIRNFKGFPFLEIPMSADSIILGGMNGFGKTTLFDAIELLFTGKIGRLDSYSKTFPNRRYSWNQTVVPLVNNKSEEKVSISALISVDGQRIEIMRKARVSDMRIPIDFTPFNTLYYFEPMKQTHIPVNEEMMHSLGFDKLRQDYSFLNYLSQEEATSFLKCKDADRAQLLQALFNTKQYDQPMSKIKKIIKALDDKMGSKRSKLEQLNKDISQLLQRSDIEGKQSDYIQLCEVSQEWDKEKPNLSYEGYNSVVSDGGIIDKLIYYLKYEKEFHNYNRNTIIKHLLSPNVIDNIIFYISTKDDKPLFDKYYGWQDDKKLIINSTVNSLESLDLSIFEKYDGIVSNEIISNVKDRVGVFSNAAKASGYIQKIISDLITKRNSFIMSIDTAKEPLDLTSCPICGNEFDSINRLWNSISEYKDIFEAQFADINEGLISHFEGLKQYLLDKIVVRIDRYFEDKCINDEIYSRFISQDSDSILKDIDYLNRLNVSFDDSFYKKKLNNQKSIIESKLHDLISVLPEHVDYQQLGKTYSSYVRYLNKCLFTEENLENKRQYLIGQWNLKASEMLMDKIKMKEKLDSEVEIFNKKKNELKALNKELKAQRAAYLNKVIDSIQILFYIYSGRILQDCYFGRGLFLKPEIDKNRVLFISGNYKDNDLDALYNMSSGQLVAVAISLLLSLNKLYSDTRLIAIDDPVQTIDDINLWGLMETLRHDFKDYYIMLSTHEKNFGQLLDYKFRKMNIKSKYIDMAGFHSENSAYNSENQEYNEAG